MIPEHQWTTVIEDGLDNQLSTCANCGLFRLRTLNCSIYLVRRALLSTVFDGRCSQPRTVETIQ